MHGAVLAVDGHQFGAGCGPQRLHHRSGGNEALFVGERQSLARPQRGHGDGQAGKAHHRVHHHIGGFDQVGQIGDHLGKGQLGRNPGALGGVGNTHHSGSELVGLGDEHIDRRANAESNHLVRACLGPHHIERLGADTAATTGDGDPDRTHFVSQGSRICIR